MESGGTIRLDEAMTLLYLCLDVVITARSVKLIDLLSKSELTRHMPF